MVQVDQDPIKFQITKSQGESTIITEENLIEKVSRNMGENEMPNCGKNKFSFQKKTFEQNRNRPMALNHEIVILIMLNTSLWVIKWSV